MATYTDASSTNSTTGTSWNDSTCTTVWLTWNENCTSASAWATGVPITFNNNGYHRRETADERAAREKSERQQRAKRKRADDAAKELLRECLTPEQRAEHEKHNRFHVVSQEGNRYRIDCDRRQHNVHRVSPDGTRIENLCAEVHRVPLCDNALAQKLMLETDEQEFRRIANIRAIA